MGETAVKENWRSIKKWIEANTDYDPGFDKGAKAKDVKNLESHMRRRLPLDFASSLRVHTKGGGIIPCPHGSMAFSLLSIDQAIDIWETMNRHYDDESLDHHRVKVSKGVVLQWWAPYWFPFAAQGPDYFCIDLCPTFPGTLGQVIFVPHDLAERPKQADTFGDFIARLAKNYLDGNYRTSEYEGMVRNKGVKFPMSSLRGHLRD